MSGNKALICTTDEASFLLAVIEVIDMKLSIVCGIKIGFNELSEQSQLENIPKPQNLKLVVNF